MTNPENESCYGTLTDLALDLLRQAQIETRGAFPTLAKIEETKNSILKELAQARDIEDRAGVLDKADHLAAVRIITGWARSEAQPMREYLAALAARKETEWVK